MSAPRLLDRDGPLRYLLQPPRPGSPGPHPVLMFLHGFDEGAPMPVHEALTRHGPLRPGNAVDALQNFLVAAPQLPVRGDVWSRYAGAVRDILTTVLDEHAGDPQRSYLTGFSFGGNGVFDLASLQPETWAALWAVDPTRVPRRDPRRPIWLSVGEVARYGKRDFIEALRLERLADGTSGDRLYLDEGADHVGSAALAYADARIYAWLLDRRLAPAA